jgi:glycosyltransferase involved in cell wall biosynthesis
MTHLGYKITLFTSDLPPTKTPDIGNDRMKMVRFPAFEIIPNYPFPQFWKWELWKSLTDLARTNPDVVISHTRFFSTSLLALIYAKARSVPYILVEHGSGFVQVTNPITRIISFAYDQIIGRLIFQLSDATVCISQAVSRFVSTFDRRQPLVIYRGMDISALDAAVPDANLRERYAGRILIATVARLYKWKGIENSIRAIKQLSPSERERVVFFIIGDGEDYERLKNLADDDASVIFLGNISRESVFSILKSIDIYIHSAHVGGGLSTSLLEALYAGCAVIASPNEGADEVIVHQKNGLLLDEPSDESIACSLHLLLEDQLLLSELKMHSRDSLANRFSWQTAGYQFSALFKRLEI